ncbi:MAG TPA: PTS fructose transporter subunit IIA [Burkholderiaceae bacterium]|jgi:PTS system ascorbate-specific IIA component|nr:PTS fructose transporter subunit IIA [Burkholderiaceae bacterium]
MVGILLLTHAPLGQAFIEAVTHIFRARPEKMEAIDVVADQDTNEVKRLALAATGRLDSGSGVLVITDVMGGTPCNCSLELTQPGHVEVVTGISLPMLLRAITYRNEPLDFVAEMALAGAQSGALRVDNRIRITTGQ